MNAVAKPSPNEASRPPRARRWQRLDALGVKLFVGIAGVNVLVVWLAYLVQGWSFEQGLSNYLDRSDQVRWQVAADRLGQAYAEHGSWSWLVADHEAWHQLLALAPDGEIAPHEAPGAGEARRRGAHGGGPDGKLMLLDASRRPQIGSRERLEGALLMPIRAQGALVGYLARPSRRDLVASLEAAVSAQQARQFAVIALGLLAAVLLNAALISRWLLRRLAPLGQGAAAVAHGDYGARIEVAGHDELARLGHDFNRMADSLARSQQARQRWIADIAHELRTPLAGLQAEIEALQDGVRQPTPERLESLAQQVQRLTRLVEDLRWLSLSDMGALEYRVVTLDLGELVADFLSHPPIAAQGLTVRQALAQGAWVRADEDRLQQVLANLWQNSLRYTDVPGTLSVSLTRTDQEVCLCWEDSAPGVPPEALPHLTDRLFRVDASRARALGGSGLGLALVQALVQGQGGRMAGRRSELGGLAWEFRWPLQEPPHG